MVGTMVPKYHCLTYLGEAWVLLMENPYMSLSYIHILWIIAEVNMIVMHLE